MAGGRPGLQTRVVSVPVPAAWRRPRGCSRARNRAWSTRPWTRTTAPWTATARPPATAGTGGTGQSPPREGASGGWGLGPPLLPHLSSSSSPEPSTGPAAPRRPLPRRRRKRKAATGEAGESAVGRGREGGVPRGAHPSVGRRPDAALGSPDPCGAPLPLLNPAPLQAPHWRGSTPAPGPLPSPSPLIGTHPTPPPLDTVTPGSPAVLHSLPSPSVSGLGRKGQLGHICGSPSVCPPHLPLMRPWQTSGAPTVCLSFFLPGPQQKEETGLRVQVSDKGPQGLATGVGMSGWARLQGHPPETGGLPQQGLDPGNCPCANFPPGGQKSHHWSL